MKKNLSSKEKNNDSNLNSIKMDIDEEYEKKIMVRSLKFFLFTFFSFLLIEYFFLNPTILNGYIVSINGTEINEIKEVSVLRMAPVFKKLDNEIYTSSDNAPYHNYTNYFFYKKVGNHDKKYVVAKSNYLWIPLLNASDKITYNNYAIGLEIENNIFIEKFSINYWMKYNLSSSFLISLIVSLSYLFLKKGRIKEDQ